MNATGAPVAVAVAIALSAGALAIGVVDRSPSQAESRYHAIFFDAGGVDPGNDVTLDGRRIGEVSAVSLVDGNAVVTFAVDANQRLGMLTTAAIRPETTRETTALVLRSVGAEVLQPGGTIPLQRTFSYSPSGGPADPSVDRFAPKESTSSYPTTERFSRALNPLQTLDSITA